MKPSIIRQTNLERLEREVLRVSEERNLGWVLDLDGYGEYTIYQPDVGCTQGRGKLFEGSATATYAFLRGFESGWHYREWVEITDNR